MAFSDKGQKLGIGIAVMLVIAVVGFSLYQTYTGEAKLSQAFVFGLLGIAALGLVRVFISSGDEKLSAQSLIQFILLIGAPITLLFLLPKLGINLFSTVGPSLGASGSFNINFAVEGGLIEWIKNNLLISSLILIGLFYWIEKRKK